MITYFEKCLMNFDEANAAISEKLIGGLVWAAVLAGFAAECLTLCYIFG